MKPEIIDSVLNKTASIEEAKQVAEWFATIEGQKYLALRFDREAHSLNEDLIAEWADHEIPSLSLQEKFSHKLRYKVKTFRFKFAAAVFIPFLLIASIFAFIALRNGIFESNNWAEISVPYGEQLQIVLQDGAKVELNSGTHLKYPKSFGLFNRKVSLVGEAYFSVAKDSSRPFIVDLNGAKVKVTGTKFNVKAYQENNIIDVSLEEGGVQFIDTKDNIYTLKPYENARYNRDNGNCTISKFEDLSSYTAWRNHSLNFYRTPLKEILKTMERQHDIMFLVKDTSLLSYKFSISTSKVNIDSILNELEKVSKIRFKLKDNNHYEVLPLNQK